MKIIISATTCFLLFHSTTTATTAWMPFMSCWNCIAVDASKLDHTPFSALKRPCLGNSSGRHGQATQWQLCTLQCLMQWTQSWADSGVGIVLHSSVCTQVLLCFAGGKEWVVIVVDDVVGNVVCWFKCSAVFGVGNLDGSVNPFFCVLEGRIAFCLRHSNVRYSFVR